MCRYDALFGNRLHLGWCRGKSIRVITPRSWQEINISQQCLAWEGVRIVREGRFGKTAFYDKSKIG